MACEYSPNVIACGPPKAIPAARTVALCPLCGQRRRLVTRYDGVYYGTTTYCLACNGQEQDGDWWKPVSDQYADYNRAYIKSLWDGGVRLPEFRRIVREYECRYWEQE